MLSLRVAKALYAATHPRCWRAFRLGVVPTIEHFPVLRDLDFDGVLDVGANRGQFTLACRLAKPGIPIVAFEPIPAEARTYRHIHGASEKITLIETALGDAAGRAQLHLSRRADSSSLLPIGREQMRHFPGTEESGTLSVSVQRLDDLVAEWTGRQNQLLKLDVQGFELPVLRGAADTLSSCRHVYVECSEIPLYEGQALRAEVQTFLEQAGFSRRGRYNPTFVSGQLVQADHLFSR